MDFHRYPVDEQTCEIKFESFGYTLTQVRKYHLTIFNFEQFGTDDFFVHTTLKMP